MIAKTLVGRSIESERMLWLLQREDGRVTLVKPTSAPYTFDVGPDANLDGAPVDVTLDAVLSFLGSQPEWSAIWAIPVQSTGAQQACARARGLPGRELGAEEKDDIVALGMEVPLGEWADGSRTSMFVLGRC